MQKVEFYANIKDFTHRPRLKRFYAHERVGVMFIEPSLLPTCTCIPLKLCPYAMNHPILLLKNYRFRFRKII